MKFEKQIKNQKFSKQKTNDIELKTYNKTIHKQTNQ